MIKGKQARRTLDKEELNAKRTMERVISHLNGDQGAGGAGAVRRLSCAVCGCSRRSLVVLDLPSSAIGSKDAIKQ